MQRFSGYLLFAAALCYPAAAAQDRDLEINVHLYDYFGMEPSVRTHAQQSAKAILLQAGIIIHWEDCLLIPKTAVAQACGAGTLDVTHFVVGVLPESMSAKIATSPEQFGKSVMGRPGGFPTQAYIFADRVVNFAEAAKTSRTTILGMITAHEIGHLLLGDDSHSSAGIMRGKWTSEDVKSALIGVLTFNPRQAELMRSEVRRRMHTMN